MYNKLVACFLILISAAKINANSSMVQDLEDVQAVNMYLMPQETIKLPWSECTEIHKLLEKKFSFTEKQIRKENRIYEEYRKFYLSHNNPTNFSLYFIEKNNENAKAEILITTFFSFFETRYVKKPSVSPMVNFKKYEQLFNSHRDIDYKMQYRRKFDDNIFLPSYNN